MVRHSRNNTASASFTKAEYDMLGDRWGSKKVKLGSESFRQFDQCSLCLNRADSPVICHEGHLFCKECIYSALLDQKKEIAAVKVTLLNLEKEHQAQRDRARADAYQRVQRDFERVQSGINGERRDVKAATSNRRERSRSPSRIAGGSLIDLPERIKAQTERAIEQAMSELEREQTQAKKDRIPAYWLPSLTPAAGTKVEDVLRKTEEALERGFSTRCFVGDKFGHDVSIKSLIDVRFVGEASVEDGSQRYLCPSCKKGLNSVGKQFALRACGHIFCAECIDYLYRPALKKAETDKEQRPACLECEKVIKSASKDLIAIQREGTGFASAGGSETKKKGISFQG